ncbi:MAG: hypothetical protein PHR42_04155 [Caldisericia bacterium]|nr:hypothetical protein [Caldisericia bacterium]
MIRRSAYILNRYSLADSGEYTVNIGMRDIITSIAIEFRATNGASGNKDNPLAECIQAVELIDGGKVLYSLTGQQLLALSAYRRGYLPYNLITEIPSNVANLFAALQFGRWIGDNQFAFDPSQFSNPQLRFKWNLATNRAVGATGYVTGSLTVTALAEIMEGAASPQGMLIAQQYFEKTTVASGVEPVLLPGDKLIKAILVRAASDSGGGLYGVSNLKLQADNNKVVLFDMRKSDIQRLMTYRNPPFHYKHHVFAKDTDVFYPVLKQDEVASFVPEVGDTVIAYFDYGIGSGALDINTGGAAATSEVDIYALVHGWMPFHTAMLDMGDWDDPATWLDPTPYREAKIEVTQDAAGAALEVVLEQVYVY